MVKAVKLRKGLDIRLRGVAALTDTEVARGRTFSLSPDDFPGVVPKVTVKEGSRVLAGDPLFVNKHATEVSFASPVSGVVAAVNRGEKRKILSVVVAADAETSYKQFSSLDLVKASREQIIELLLESGLWTMFVQRPYGVVANPSDKPKAIFVSAFDTAPLAPDYYFALDAKQGALAKGFEVLRRLTDGKVHLGVDAKKGGFTTEPNQHWFEGKHPAGNVGVQIHHIDPINKGEKVWTLNIQDVAILGRMFLTGKVDLSRVIAVAGSCVAEPKYYRVVAGASIESILGGKLSNEHARVISGNVLTGRNVGKEGFLGVNANQITAIPEGDDYELLGWAMPRFKKFSVSRAYFSWLFPWKKYNLDTNMNGGERAFVMNDLYEKYLPMDIYPVHLVKACLAGDLDKMENLGIYEVVEEDLALCEFVCPSKIEFQQIIRNGINLMIKEGE